MKALITAHMSHPGARPEQQDRVAIFADHAAGEFLLVVADGVGGSEGGALASQTIIDTAGVLWKERRGGQYDPEGLLDALCTGAHQAILQMGKRENLRPRSTIAAVCIRGGTAAWAHCGDSRVYHFRNHRMVDRTRDHSVVQILVDKGKVREEEMGHHRAQNRLTQMLGSDEFQEPDFNAVQLDGTDGFLLCTDGFWEHTSVEEMGGVVTSPEDAMPEVLQRAVGMAARRGGADADNIAVAAIAGGGGAAGGGFPALLRHRLLISTALAVGGLMSAWLLLHGLFFSVSPGPIASDKPTPSPPLESTPAGSPLPPAIALPAVPVPTPTHTPGLDSEKKKELGLGTGGNAVVPIPVSSPPVTAVSPSPTSPPREVIVPIIVEDVPHQNENQRPVPSLDRATPPREPNQNPPGPVPPPTPRPPRGPIAIQESNLQSPSPRPVIASSWRPAAPVRPPGQPVYQPFLPDATLSTENPPKLNEAKPVVRVERAGQPGKSQPNNVNPDGTPKGNGFFTRFKDIFSGSERREQDATKPQDKR